MTSNQETSGGFLPPTNTGFTDDFRRQTSPATTTLTGNNPHPLSRFTKLNISATDTATQDSHLAAGLGRATFRIPSTPFASPAVDTYNAITPTVSDITTSSDQEHTTTTSITPPKGRESPRRNPLRRTLSDTISPVRKPTSASLSSIGKESPQFKRLKKTEEMETEFGKKCWDVRSESGVTEEDVDDDDPSEVIMEKEEGRREFVGVRRLDDGSLNIKLSCSCGNCFELLRNGVGCFYRLKIDKALVDLDP